MRETPDFVCEAENGDRVGVELTKIIAHPESRQWHRLFGSGAMHCTGDIASAIAKDALYRLAESGSSMISMFRNLTTLASACSPIGPATGNPAFQPSHAMILLPLSVHVTVLPIAMIAISCHSLVFSHPSVGPMLNCV
jgi:hypothetical protein